MLFSLLSIIAIFVTAQSPQVWNNKQCAIVLTYDDAIDIDLDNVIPALDSFNLKGTFYIIGSSPVVNKRMNEWRMAAQNGHELGNHALVHPCDASKPGREWVSPETDLSKYTVKRAVSEIRINNTLLKAIDGKDKRTFAYPCADTKIGDSLFYNGLRKDFVGARGVNARMDEIDKVDLDNIDCFSISGKTAEYMIGLVQRAMQTHTLLVFLFHGVGGGHSINEDRGAHTQLLQFLKQHESEIWIAPMVEVAEHIKNYRSTQLLNKPKTSSEVPVNGPDAQILRVAIAAANSPAS